MLAPLGLTVPFKVAEVAVTELAEPVVTVGAEAETVKVLRDEKLRLLPDVSHTNTCHLYDEPLGRLTPSGIVTEVSVLRSEVYHLILWS
jgi:hypothetical protein